MNKRCEKILSILNSTEKPVTASQLAEEFGVSRQIIVGDVAILRAAGFGIIATARGYKIETGTGENRFGYIGIIPCIHGSENLAEELYTIVDFGGTVIDVTIEHAIYGSLSGKLDLSSRYEVDGFIKRVSEQKNSQPISILTGGIHTHQIGCPSKSIFNEIKNALKKKGIVFEQ